MITQNFKFTVTKDYVFKVDEFDPPFFWRNVEGDTDERESRDIQENCVNRLGRQFYPIG